MRRIRIPLLRLLVFLAAILLLAIPSLVISQKLDVTANNNQGIDHHYANNANTEDKRMIVRQDYGFEGAYDKIDNFFIQNGVSQIDDFQITNLVLTSDIEGNLNAVNRRTGELLWSLVGGQPLVNIKSDSDNSDAHYTTPVAPVTRQTDGTSQYSRYSNPNLFESSHTLSNKHIHNNNSSSNRRNMANQRRKDITWIVEPYGDGTVYHFMGDEGLEKIPISIKQFVLNSPFAIDDQFIYTGSRTSGIVKINARTGAIVESFGLETKGTCSTGMGDFNTKNDDITIDADYLSTDDPYDDGFDGETDYYGSHGYNSKENEVGPFITLGKTIYDLTIHSKNNTSWNITYVQWGPNNLHSNLIDQNTQSADDIYIQPFHDSSLLALDIETKSIKWVSNLPYVTVNVFDIFANSLVDNDYVMLPHPLDHQASTRPNGEKSDSTYLDRTKEGSWYALSEEHYPSLVRSAPVAKYITNERWRLPSIFTNDDLLGIAISGVHDNSLKKNEIENPQKLLNNKHLAIYQSATAMSVPEKYNQMIQGGHNGAHYANGIEDRNRKIDENTMSYVDSMINSPTLTFKNSSFSKLVYRALENVFVALICLAILFVLSRFGLLKDLLGYKQQQPDVVESEKSVTIEIVNDTPTTQEDSNQLEDSTITQDEDFADDSEITANKDDDKEEKDDNEDTNRRKRKRGSRGGKKNKKKDLIEGITSTTIISSSTSEDDNSNHTITLSNSGSSSNSSNLTSISNNLSITDTILGFGSHGTIVFKGFFENRPVAVKRMLLEFYDVASHEINLLQESDDHSNVIRYFCSQEKNKFLYIALELCSASLEDLVEKKKDELDVHIETSQILYQIANGVNHLHSLKIVHRDIKPQNILVALSKKGKINDKSVRFLISDFGLCKKLDADQSSFKGTTANAAGTSGWRAPELLLDTSPAYAETSLAHRVRLTRSVDVFSAGCVFFYVLTGGYHPFGDRYIREGNIIKGEYDLSKLNSLPEAYTIKDLISQMIQKNPMSRPDISAILKHPYFWSVEKKLEFLLKVSDRFEVERRDPPSELLLKLESIAPEVLGPKGWFDKFDNKFIDNLGKYRKYNTHKIMDLLRAIRNKYHHYQDLPEDLAAEMSPLPDGFYWYFQRKFPRMLLVVYKLMEKTLHDDELLGQFF